MWETPHFSVGRKSFNLGISQHGLDNALLFLIVQTDDLNKINELIEEGADIDYSRGLPLKQAILYKKFDIAKALINKGANLNIGNESPLTIALTQEYSEDLESLVCLLLSKGVNPKKLPWDLFTRIKTHDYQNNHLYDIVRPYILKAEFLYKDT